MKRTTTLTACPTPRPVVAFFEKARLSQGAKP
jgi:hypothetical protein